MTNLSATFFNKHLTGAKQSTGFFDPNLNPIHKNNYENYELIDSKFITIPGFYSRSLRIPTYFINKNTYQNTRSIMPLAQYRSILTINNQYSIKAALIIHTIELNYKGRISNQVLDHINIMFEPTILVQDLGSKTNTYFVTPNVKSKNKSRIYKNYSQNPKTAFTKLINQLCSEFKFNDDVNSQLLTDINTFLNDFSLQKQLAKQIDIFINDLPKLARKYKAKKHISFWNTVITNTNHYQLPIKTYQDIVKAINSVPSNIKSQELSTNAYLLLLDNLKALDYAQSKLPVVNSNNFVPDKFNKDQQALIKTDKPLTLLQSVAGSGKSSTILGRIDYLLASNINPANITVLSFTNAASNHIKQAKPKINSLTIAKLIHDTYQQNYQHVLSNTKTLINSLNVFTNDNSRSLQEFIRLLTQVDKSENNDNILQLMHFISLHQDQVLIWLDEINQTNLILELILVYLNLDTWQSPYDTDFLIVDEVQDTSIFQFIYLLKYANVQNANVLFVGDASQTLYEFRGADPNALNILEELNIFTPYKLQINYRSNANILTYANQMLSTISANKYANLQLKPVQNSQDKFSDHVKYTRLDVSSVRDINTYKLTDLYEQKLYSFIDESIKNKQKVAILSLRRDTADLNYDILTQHYSQLNIANLTMPQIQDLNLITNYLDQFGAELDLLPIKNLDSLVISSIKGKLPELVPYAVLNNTPLLNKIFQELDPMIRKFWASEKEKIKSGINTKTSAISTLKTRLLAFEIDWNTRNQTYFDESSNKLLDLATNSDLIVSTIHGTKGLEFDNTIIFMTNTHHLTQEDRRLYYVAETRAKNNEFIVDCSNSLGSFINTSYLNLVK